MMEMMNPPHVGEVIRYEVLEPLGLKVTDAAKVLGVSRPALSNLLNGRAAFVARNGHSASKRHLARRWKHLLRMQLAYDLARAHAKAEAIHVQRYEPVS